MNTPQHPEDERAGNEPTQGAPRSEGENEQGNPYATQYQRSVEPDLDASAPELRATDVRRMNQRALLFLGIIILVIMLIAFWLLKSGSSSSTEKPKAREERVNVEQAPSNLIQPQAPVASTQQRALPIPLAPPMPIVPNQNVSQGARGQTLLERRIEASNGDSGGNGSANPLADAQKATDKNLPVNPDAAPATAQQLPHPDTLMQRGTYIRCVLETRIISDIPGFSTCLVTEPVYSFNGHTLLLPKGSKLLGSYSGGPRGDREAVIWDRIITPTGIDVNMSSPGMDNLGGAGIPGYYNAHWNQRITSALLISLLSDAFKYEAARKGPKTTTIADGGVAVQEPFQSNTAQTVQNLADQAVRESANRTPTVTINQGTVIYVYVTKDVDFSGVVARS